MSSTAGRWFRYAAIAETISWVGLLIGMFFKYVVVKNDIGVFVFGRVHGAMFVFYLATMLWTAKVHRWGFGRLVVGGAASIPPFLGLLFERWVAKRDAAAEPAEAEPAVAAAR